MQAEYQLLIGYLMGKDDRLFIVMNLYFTGYRLSLVISLHISLAYLF